MSFEDIRINSGPAGAALLQLSFRLPAVAPDYQLGYQIFDARSRDWVAEGDWIAVQPSHDLNIRFPIEPGRYQAFVSTRDDASGWHYDRGSPFLFIEADVDANAQISVRHSATRTLRSLRWSRLPGTFAKFFTTPFETLIGNRGLIASLVKRELLARYRGSFGDFLWTILNPLLLMATYYFVFAVVLRTRFPGDPTREGFVLYFLAGILPWLAISDPLTRSTVTVHENRNLIKKLVLPVEILPANVTLSGLVTGLIAFLIFFVVLFFTRGAIPLSALWFPLVLAVQWLLTVGIAWTLASLGAYFRDLGHIIGYLLTLWFFLTPICYPESSLPEAALPILGKNPLWTLVRTYRLIFLEGRAPEWISFSKLTLLAVATFFGGHAIFYRLRRKFADII